MRDQEWSLLQFKKNHLWLLNYSHWLWFEIWFPEKDFALGKGAVNIINVTANDLENYINPIDKAVAGSERVDPTVEVRIQVKCCQRPWCLTEMSVMKGGAIAVVKLVIFQAISIVTQPLAITTLSKQHCKEGAFASIKIVSLRAAISSIVFKAQFLVRVCRYMHTHAL